MKKVINSNKNWCGIVICMYLLINTLNLTIKNLFDFSSDIDLLISIIFAVSLAVLSLMAFPWMAKACFGKFLIVELIAGFLVAYSMLLGEAEYSLLLKMAFKLMCIDIPMGFFVYSCADIKYILYGIFRIRYILDIILWVGLSSAWINNIYQMQLSYALIIPLLANIYQFVQKHKLFDGIVTVVSIVLIIFAGSRGSLLCIGAFVLALLFLYENNKKKKLIYVILGLLSLLLIIVVWEKITDLAGEYLQNSDQREAHYILERIVDGTFFDNSSRGELWKYYIDKILERPFGGWGIVGGWISGGDGPHNMLLELILAFGFPVGGVICLVFVGCMLYPIIVDHSEDKILILIFWSFCVPFLYIRGNWIEFPEIMIYVAIVISHARDCRKRIRNRNEE